MNAKAAVAICFPGGCKYATAAVSVKLLTETNVMKFKLRYGELK